MGRAAEWGDVMTRPLEQQYELPILLALREIGGFTTGHIAATFKSPFGRTKRQHSSDVRSWLLAMRLDGLVCNPDNQKPVIWERTKAGTAAIHRKVKVDA